MRRLPARSPGFTLLELIIVVAIIAVIAAIAIPSLLAASRAANERNAASSLKTLASAEVDYRSNDRNGDGVNNFRIGIWGLYAATNLRSGAEVRLIELSMALADADVDQNGGGYYLPGSSLSGAAMSAKAGYWYEDLETDANGILYDPDDTEHNLSCFAFAAWPESRSAGKILYIISEENVVYRSAACGIGAVYELQSRSLMPNNLNAWPGGSPPSLMSLWTSQ